MEDGKKNINRFINMMNKVFELIEAKKIFNIKKNKISILIHPTSYIHAIVLFKNDLIKLLAHDADMKIPISNALNMTVDKKIVNLNINKLNEMKFILPNYKKFPLISLIDKIPDNDSYFETILISLNDLLVDKYLNGEINYISIQKIY